MSHRPKPVRDHYIESLAVNSENLARQMAEKSVPANEARIIRDMISRLYLLETDRIVRECEKDMMTLEKVPSPLRLFVDSIAQALKTTKTSPAASLLLRNYVSAWEDWM